MWTACPMPIPIRRIPIRRKEMDAATSWNRPTRPRRPGDQSAGEGLGAVAPSTAVRVGMGTPPTQRPIGEGAVHGGAALCRAQSRRARAAHPQACRCVALALDDPRETRRYFPIPSPSSSPLPADPAVEKSAPLKLVAFAAWRALRAQKSAVVRVYFVTRREMADNVSI
jgi:hypothetical protein